MSGGRSSITRRPIDSEVPRETLISYVPVTSLYSKNGIAITRHSGGDLDGKLNTVTISDGFVNKVLTMTYDGTMLTGFTTQITKVP